VFGEGVGEITPAAHVLEIANCDRKIAASRFFSRKLNPKEPREVTPHLLFEAIPLSMLTQAIRGSSS
jgi:hypothetical protein